MPGRGIFGCIQKAVTSPFQPKKEEKSDFQKLVDLSAREINTVRQNASTQKVPLGRVDKRVAAIANPRATYQDPNFVRPPKKIPEFEKWIKENNVQADDLSQYCSNRYSTRNLKKALEAYYAGKSDEKILGPLWAHHNEELRAHGFFSGRPTGLH